MTRHHLCRYDGSLGLLVASLSCSGWEADLAAIEAEAEADIEPSPDESDVARVDLWQAVHAAMVHVPGLVVAAELDLDALDLHYAVAVLADGAVSHVAVDASTGATEWASARAPLPGELAASVAMTVADAIAFAEHHVDGVAFAAGVDRDEFIVFVLAGDVAFRVVIAPSGKVRSCEVDDGWGESEFRSRTHAAVAYDECGV